MPQLALQAMAELISVRQVAGEETVPELRPGRRWEWLRSAVPAGARYPQDHVAERNPARGCHAKGLSMRIGMHLNYAGGFAETVAELADFEQAGLDIVFVPEAYSFDAVSQLGFIAAQDRAAADRLGHLASSTPAPRR